MRIPIKLNGYEKIIPFVAICESYSEDINLHYRHFTIDAKSIMGVLSCDLLQQLYVEIISHDEETKRKFEKDMEKFK